MLRSARAAAYPAVGGHVSEGMKACAAPHTAWCRGMASEGGNQASDYNALKDKLATVFQRLGVQAAKNRLPHQEFMAAAKVAAQLVEALKVEEAAEPKAKGPRQRPTPSQPVEERQRDEPARPWSGTSPRPAEEQSVEPSRWEVRTEVPDGVAPAPARVMRASLREQAEVTEERRPLLAAAPARREAPVPARSIQELQKQMEQDKAWLVAKVNCLHNLVDQLRRGTLQETEKLREQVDRLETAAHGAMEPIVQEAPRKAGDAEDLDRLREQVRNAEEEKQALRRQFRMVPARIGSRQVLFDFRDVDLGTWLLSEPFVLGNSEEEAALSLAFKADAATATASATRGGPALAMVHLQTPPGLRRKFEVALFDGDLLRCRDIFEVPASQSGGYRFLSPGNQSFNRLSVALLGEEP